MVVMGTNSRLLLKDKTMSSNSQLWCFSETAGGHIPGQLPETTEDQKAQRANSRPGRNNCVYSAPLPLHKNNHDIAKLEA